MEAALHLYCPALYLVVLVLERFSVVDASYPQAKRLPYVRLTTEHHLSQTSGIVLKFGAGDPSNRALRLLRKVL